MWLTSNLSRIAQKVCGNNEFDISPAASARSRGRLMRHWGHTMWEGPPSQGHVRAGSAIQSGLLIFWTHTYLSQSQPCSWPLVGTPNSAVWLCHLTSVTRCYSSTPPSAVDRWVGQLLSFSCFWSLSLYPLSQPLPTGVRGEQTDIAFTWRSVMNEPGQSREETFNKG